MGPRASVRRITRGFRFIRAANLTQIDFLQAANLASTILETLSDRRGSNPIQKQAHSGPKLVPRTLITGHIA
jgi:hypothetical protein